LNIYEASNTKLIAQWQIDDTILNILNPSVSYTENAVSSFRTVPKSINDGVGRVIGFNYSSVLWSPDGHRLAVSFMTSLQQQPMYGLLLINVDGQHTQLMLQPQHDVNEFPIEWDLWARMTKPFQRVQPALQFHWEKDGTLSSKMLLSYSSVPSISNAASVGSPEGENFTIWQPGYAALTNMSGLSVWSTNFEAWSPNGRYIIDSIRQVGLMKPRNRLILDTQTLEQMRISYMPLLPAHDVALLQVAITSSVIAWRPDGRIMAAFNYYDTVNLYDCVTGHKIASLPLHFRKQPLAGNAALLRWSPNGTHLLLSSVWGGAISLWGPDELPR
jgi:WD40 repeat protein